MGKVLINEVWFQEAISKSKINVVDGGARGEVFEPFNLVNPEFLHVIRFEPDNNAAIETSENHTVIPKALWSHPAKLQLHLANNPYVSSVYPPDEKVVNLLWKKDKLRISRATSKVLEVNSESLDNLILSKDLENIDFIKLDIHGAEYEALIGAKDILDNLAIGVLVETWSMPVHQGQKLHSHVESYLNDKGFYMFAQLATGSAKRNNRFTTFSARQTFKWDCLFFKEMLLLDKNKFQTIKVLKLIGIADLFGYYGYAIELLDALSENGEIEKALTDKLFKHISNKSDLKVKYISKLIDKLQKYLSRF